jgi:tRNA(fMet)-specific endonuclease VapC
MIYLLDTNICIHLINHDKILRTEAWKIPAEKVATSIITIAELKFGAYNSRRVRDNLANIAKFSEHTTTLPLTSKIVEEYAKIKAALRRRGITVGDFDLLLGATALVNDLILVTNNQAHFANIDDIKLENWVSSRT